MSLTVSSYESKFYLHIIIELGYLFEIISYSLTLYEHYCVYLQWLVIRFLKATKHKKKIFLILQILSNLCQQTTWPQSRMYL